MHTLRSGDATIAYDIDGDGDPLLLIMGLGADRRMWMLQLPVLTQHFRCITFDNRGIGDSTAPEGPFTMEQMAADALAVLDEAQVERAHVLAISMGGAPMHPQWYYNLKAHPECELGDEKFLASEITDPDEYARVYGLAEQVYAGWSDYRLKTDPIGRRIPVFRLKPR